MASPSQYPAAEKVIAAIKAHGLDGVRPGADGLRDAAHEAFHALAVGAGSWNRERVHRALCRQFVGANLWIHEMEARGVEQVVCMKLGVDCGSLGQWVATSAMEAIKGRLPYADPSVSEGIARRFMQSDACAEWAHRIIAMGES